MRSWGMVNFPESFRQSPPRPFSVWLWVFAPDGYDGFTVSAQHDDFMGADVLRGLSEFCSWWSSLAFVRSFELDLFSPADWIDMDNRLMCLLRERVLRRNDLFCVENLQTGEEELLDVWLSKPLLAEFLLGVSDCGDRWVCSYDDLTDSGQRFYDLVARFYEGCRLVIVSFLHT